jgi:predicted dehydrogenase
MVEKRFRWGIIGPGRIAKRFADSFSLLPQAELYAVASRDAVRGKEFASAYGIPKVYTNYEDLVKDKEVDAIYISTPHAFHYECALLCLKNNKPVLCEKPLTLNRSLAQVMINTARENNTFLMEAMWTRFIPATVKALELIRSGVIGEVKFIYADFGFATPFNPDSRIYDLKLGGGAQLDVGIYPMFLALVVLGKPENIKAFAKLATTGADENTSALFYYNDGAIANIYSSIVAESPKQADIIGTKGTISIHTPWYKSQALTLTTGRDDKKLVNIPYPGTGFEFQIEEVMRCVKENKIESDLMSHSFSLMMAEVSDDIRRQVSVKYFGE